MKIRVLILCLSSLFVVASCCETNKNSPSISAKLSADINNLESLAVYSTETKPLMNIKLKREPRFGNNGQILIGRVSHIAVDDLGRVYLGDGGWGYRGVHVFKPDGTFIKTMGGEGKGPGEILAINNMGIINDELYLYDGEQKRVNFYSLQSLSIKRTQILDTDDWSHVDALHGSYPSGYHFRDDSICLVSFIDPISFKNPDKDRYIDYYLANKDGKVISKRILRLKAMNFIKTKMAGNTQLMTLEYPEKSIIAHSKNNNIVTAWTEDFLLKKYGPKGNYKGAIYYPFARQKIDKNKILNKFDEAWKSQPQQIKNYKRRIRNTDLPERWPALESILVDDEGRIWVATIGEDEQNFDWWVLKDSGESLARFKFPRSDEVIDVKNGFLYARMAEEGTDPVVRFRIILSHADGNVEN